MSSRRSAGCIIARCIAPKEPQWWARLGVEPLVIAQNCGAQTHPLPTPRGAEAHGGSSAAAPEAAATVVGAHNDQAETNPIR